MSLRCGCTAEGDAIVFGDLHECSKNPDLRNPKSRGISPLAPSWAFVVSERPHERVLGEDEIHD